eukprot:TRINITY_DN15252_c0_g1_i1.p1 TRINITY_DN15252_c0_g1~~TRINITY_DN15252_c0_g1_i1.p1  ORF type:complete len:651 (+),score=287.96 TRINITY_DN15252_c0_g1_i1:55-1953(+)
MVGTNGRVALFAGPADTAFRCIKERAELPQVAPIVQRTADTLKNAGGIDLMKDLQAGSWTETSCSAMGEEGGHVVALKLLAQVAEYLEHHKVEDLPREFIAATGDRPGMLAAVLLAASDDIAQLEKNLASFTKAALVMGARTESTTPQAVMEQWQAQGVQIPAAAALRLPVLGCDGRGDLRRCDDLTQQLASLMVVTDTPPSTAGMQESHDSVKRSISTVVPFGCPESTNGRIQIAVDGVRDLPTLNYMMPDVAAIKREVVKRGHSVDVSLPLSFLWLLHDLVLNAALMYLTYLLLPYVSDTAKWSVLWPIYSVVVGTTLTGVWVIGHECGHRAFAGTGGNTLINDLVGFVTHTPLLVPFWAWRYSHHKHHMFTNHLLDGETHVPSHRNGTGLDMSVSNIIGDDAFVFWNVFQHLVFGWPLYLVNNATGGRRTPQGKKIDRKKPVSHFKASSQVFENNQRSMILPGTLGCIAWLCVLAYVDFTLGLGTALFWFWGAYLVVNGWLVLYTWLHHSDKDIPHFSDGHFSYMRGATSSCDRAYPSLINYIHHHIGSTHVLHHISFQLPHYRAEAATEVFRGRYPHLYRYDSRSLLTTLMEVSRYCHYVDDVTGVQYYKSLPQLVAERKAQKAQKAQ